MIFLIDALGGAADLDAFRPVGIEGAVSVVLRLAATATTAPAIAVAATLALHAFEISHSSLDLLGIREKRTITAADIIRQGFVVRVPGGDNARDLDSVSASTPVVR
jgi:hypothetical protein